MFTNYQNKIRKIAFLLKIKNEINFFIKNLEKNK